uniref:Uncharacterized protein n=1 Tax=Thermogemmatispora argillosa TaxID=2045280 RepID=A0A455SZP5_9CHLR|nr:hypothetical protein KTA_05810 [Thermogemmatispora argillosa]
MRGRALAKRLTLGQVSGAAADQGGAALGQGGQAYAEPANQLVSSYLT